MEKGISTKIDDELLRDIHICAAKKGVSIQQYVTDLIEKDLFPERFPEITENQPERLKGVLDVMNRALGDIAGILRGEQKQAASGMAMEL